MKFLLERRPYRGAIGVHAYIEHSDGRLDVVTSLTLTSVERGHMAPQEPMLDLTQTEAQQLMDELWNVGLRPSEGTGSAGSLAATEKHLADMRSIAFAALQRDGVEVMPC